MTYIELKELPQNLLTLKVKTTLFSIGMQERYIAFEYLSSILTEFISNDDESLFAYKKILYKISNKYNITAKTISQNLNKIFKTCTDENIKNRMQFNLSGNSILNKVRVLKNYLQSVLITE